jgi:hypothetical protein
MANTFKNAALANASNSSYSTLYTAPSSTTSVLLGVALANKTGNSVTVQVQFTDTSASSATFQLLESVSIPGNTTLEVLQGQKYILETGDLLKIKAGTANAIDAVAGLMEIT